MTDERYALMQSVAQQAGQLALTHLSDLKANRFPVEVKGPQDFVTHADRNVETFIRKVIKETFPQDRLLGEEHGLEPGELDASTQFGEDQLTWVIDPIDGTANFIRDIDQWAISIALVSKAGMEAGVIYDPVRDALYHARVGRGAFLNDRPLEQAKQVAPADPILVLGRSKRKPFGDYLKALSFLENRDIEYRRFGSAAMGLAQVACGQCDGYYEADLNPWDCLAGLLLVKEVGGVILAGQNIYQTLANGPVCAVHPYLENDIKIMLADQT